MFDKDFETGEEMPIHFGRFVIGGGYIVRLMFCPDGKMRLAVEQSALDDKSVLVTMNEEYPYAHNNAYGIANPFKETTP